MNGKDIKHWLDQELDDRVPASEVQMWAAVREVVEDEFHKNQQSKTVNFIFRRRWVQLAFAVVIAVVVLAGSFLTPLGRAFAQRVVHFFTPAESSVFPLDPSQVPAENLELAPVSEAPTPLIRLEEAESLAGFDALELPEIPEGFEYQGVRMNEETIILEYQVVGMGGSLMIRQSQEGFYQSDWDRVPAEVIVPVKIGEQEGEFVQGAFVVLPETEEATWNSDIPMMRLRWREKDLYLQLTKHGNVEAIQALDKEGLIELAESMEPGS